MRSFVSRKLGSCPVCIRSSALGTGALWLLYGVATLAGAPGAIRVALAVMAAAFTLLLAAHFVAMAVRATTYLAERAEQPPGHAPVSRRDFGGRAVRLAGLGVLGAIFGVGMAPPAGAAAACEGDHRIEGTETAFGSGCTPRQARRSARQNARQFCRDYCDTQSGCGADPCVAHGVSTETKFTDTSADSSCPGGTRYFVFLFIRGCECDCA